MATNFDPSIFTIDSDRLDVEWETQASRCYEACRLAAQAQMTVADLKRRIEVKRAELDLDIRRDPAKYGFTAKPTEKAIESCIAVSEELVTLYGELTTAKYQYDLYSAAVNALEHKKKGLDALTQLRTINYYTSR